MKEHEKFKRILEQKKAANPRWRGAEKLLYNERGYGIPDGRTPSGRPIELKPHTQSGIQQGRKQLEKYEDASGQRGILVLYDKVTGQKTYIRTPYQTLQ